MKAAVMRATGHPLAIEDVPAPEIGPEEVLVETRTCGICGTDLHILEGRGYVPPLPHILGHEPAGVVAAIGQRVTRYKVGDRVVPHLFFTCGECFFCRDGRDEQCANLRGILGVLVNGAFAEYFKAPESNLFFLPLNVSFEEGGLLADAVVTSVHAHRRSNLQSGEIAVVLGCGGVGLTLIQVLKAAGVRVVGVDRSDESLSLSRELGAELTLNSADPGRVRKVREFTGGLGARCVFNCVGTGGTMRDSVDYVMTCGRIVVIGEEADSPAVSTTEIAQRELEIVGSRNGTRQDMAEAIRLLASGRVKPPIARRFSLAQINEALALVRSGALGRVVITVKD
ncbi:MAG: alcohol dehydrogenase catalytic domain-containing protein [Acidobacteriia bacterium]|nr:alcohol dehydrogenase catalytic domain-containing protein [Terriglobia bacterium]